MEGSGIILIPFCALLGDVEREMGTHSSLFCLLAVGVQGALLYYSTETCVEGDGPRH